MTIHNGNKTIGKQWTPRKEHDDPSILSRWQNDDRYITSQLAIGWTENCCRYLDYLTTIDISHKALYHQRNRYESTITRPPTTVGVAEPELGDTVTLVIFVITFAEVVGRHSMARRSMERSPIARSLMERS